MTDGRRNPHAGSAPDPLDRAFFGRDTVVVARELLGTSIVSRILPGPPRIARIVEVEAYLGERDAASHARRGRTPRTAVMFGPAGHAYVYLIYGIHHCLNLVTESDGVAGAVLLRAAEPVSGFDSAGGAGAARLLAGPGKLCAALGITRIHDGLDLVDSAHAGPLSIHAAAPDDASDEAPGSGSGSAVRSGRRPGRGGPSPRVRRSARIGVDYAGAWAARKLRFYLAGHPAVSVRPRD